VHAANGHNPLPISEWPLLDREAWARANDGDEFSAGGIAAEWSPRSHKCALWAYGCYLGFLQRNDRLHSVIRVGHRLLTDDLRAFGYELSSRLAPLTVRWIFASLSMAIRAMDPSADRTLLIRIVSRLSLRAKSVRDIGGNLLPPKQLVAIGQSLMDQAENSPARSGWRRASLYRDGLLMNFLALCPLRPGAVSELQIGEHVMIDGTSVTVHLPPADRKKRRPENVPLTAELARRMLRYITHYRPMLPVPDRKHAHALWISRNGQPLSCDAISKRVKERIGRRTGKRFTAHMFRHASATFIVDAAPERAPMIVGVLGHSGFRTAQRHYIKGQQHTAMRTYQKAALDLVRRARQDLVHRGGSLTPSKRRRSRKVKPRRPRTT
jgi:integrase